MRICARGITLIEIIVSTALFLIMMTMLFGGFRVFMNCWRSAESKDAAHRKFLRLTADFQIEFLRTDIDTLISGSSNTKNWICFKSNTDSNGTPHHDETGYPIWKKYILYYAIRPQNDSCRSDLPADYICPHKYIIRKDIDISENIVDESQINKYLTFTLALNEAASESNLLYLKPLTNDILEMRGHRDADKAVIHLKILRIEEATRHVPVGAISLVSENVKPYINEFVFAVRPKNREI